MRLLKILVGLLMIMLMLAEAADARRRQPRPWPEVNLSILPSVLGMTNSWEFEIASRSPAYLSDIDRLHIAAAFGRGKNENSLNSLANGANPRWGYNLYNTVDYQITDLKLKVYSHLGQKTFGSLWATYGKDRDATTKSSFIESIPNRLNVRTAFAWRILPKWTVGVSGTFDNYPRSYVFAFQQQGTSAESTQVDLPANLGENYSGELDLLYRPRNDLDIIFGGRFQRQYSKFTIPGPPPGSTYRDTSEVKEFFYSGAPRVSVKKSYPSGSFVRAGASYYFNLFDYSYFGAGDFQYPDSRVPSYRSQKLETFIPDWQMFLDGSRLLGRHSVLYSSLEMGGYPNYLTASMTDFVPIRLSLIDADNVFSAVFVADLAGQLTRILNAMVGVRIRYVDMDAGNGVTNFPIDDRSIYASLRAGTTTRIHRNLWWTIRLENLRLQSSEEVGSVSLFENVTYIETEVLFLGI